MPILLSGTPRIKHLRPFDLASSDLNIGPTSPITPPPATRALTRITPVAPQAATELEGSPLRRSGLNVLELFNAPDQVVVRSGTPAAALELGLEQARGSMVRNHPADALATLDEVWSGARHTETGWYLRGGSLALLGLPGEASRVAAEALQTNPQSSANHFLQSLAKLTLGDVAAAGLSLANAAAHSEPEALLLIQHALIEAQRGNVSSAEELLRRAATNWPDHPALMYGRDMMREVLRNSARERQRTPAQSFLTPVNEPAVQTPSSSRTPVSSTALLGPLLHSETEDRAHARDIASDALRDLGTELASGTKRQVLTEARALLVSLSAGGALSSSMTAVRAHAARAVIGAIIDAMNSGAQAGGVGWEAESVDGQWQRAQHDGESTAHQTENPGTNTNEALHNAVRALVAALRDGRVAEADMQLRRARGSLGENTFTLLRAILSAGAGNNSDVDDAHARSAQSAANAAYDPGAAQIQDGFAGHTLLAPLRLGLALLPEAELGHGTRMPSGSHAAVSYSGSNLGVSFGDEPRNIVRPPGTPGSLVAAVGLIALAVLAFSTSHPIMAIALTGAGGWVALRKTSQGARL